MPSYKIYKTYSLNDDYLELFPRSKFVDDISKADFVLIDDGPPPDPLLYNRSILPSTLTKPFFSSSRDYIDKQAIEEAILCKIPIVGIGRGASVLGLIAGTNIIQTYEKDNCFSNIKITINTEDANYNKEIDAYTYTKSIGIPYPINAPIRESNYIVLSKHRDFPKNCMLEDFVPVVPKFIPDIIKYKNLNGVEALGINSDPKKIIYMMTKRQQRPMIRPETVIIYKKMLSYISLINGTIYNMVKASRNGR